MKRKLCCFFPPFLTCLSTSVNVHLLYMKLYISLVVFLFSFFCMDSLFSLYEVLLFWMREHTGQWLIGFYSWFPDWIPWSSLREAAGKVGRKQHRDGLTAGHTELDLLWTSTITLACMVFLHWAHRILWIECYHDISTAVYIIEPGIYFMEYIWNHKDLYLKMNWSEAIVCRCRPTLLHNVNQHYIKKWKKRKQIIHRYFKKYI